MSQHTQITLWQRIKSTIFHIFPHHWVSRIVYYLARFETPLKTPLIRAYIRFFNVDMHEAEAPRAEDYRNFNHFFTRSLQPDARPIHDDPKTLIYPCDGTVIQVGEVQDGALLQAKGQHYELEELLGGSNPQARKAASAFSGGKFLTVYLAPGNYHRVHAPCDIELKTMTHVPGRLFSVARYASEVIPRLYARNERVISIFDSSFGNIAVVMVGALNVGSMETVWSGLVTPKRFAVTRNQYESNPPLPEINFKRGEEIGRFNIGSTVIMLVANPELNWNPMCIPGKEIHMGEESGWVDNSTDL